MTNSSNISLINGECIKCGECNGILLSPCYGRVLGNCDHKFCRSCFRIENMNLVPSPYCTFTCPCCHAPFYGNMLSIDEAILIGEVASVRKHIAPLLRIPESTELAANEVRKIDDTNKAVVERLEPALQSNPTNFYTLYALFLACNDGYKFLRNHKLNDHVQDFYEFRLFNYALILLDFAAIIESFQFVRLECYRELAYIFDAYCNHSAALKYAKLAYEHCLRSSEHTNLSSYKALYLESRDAFAKLPPLRFAVGDEVEFLHELEAGSEWKLGKVVELYYRERDFEISLSVPYRIQLLAESDSASAGESVYAWVKADIDRYVRKVGVRSIEDTRYQARLDAKVAELAEVYCSEEFIQNIYRKLAQDYEFVEMLQCVWQVELSPSMLCLYRMLVMYRQPFVRTDSGYHVSSTDEIIAEIKAYFDLRHLSGGSAKSELTDAQWIRTDILMWLRGTPIDSSGSMDENDIRGQLLVGVHGYIEVLSRLDYTAPYVNLEERGRDFTVPSDISEAISKVSSTRDLWQMIADLTNGTRMGYLVTAWMGVHLCSEHSYAGPACDCPFVYFFVKYCLDQSLGVPKLALALYDRMNMQLSREFIRCANPTCELNKLDKSTGKVKFKNCSRCKAVIYCSKECQTAHYPEHKRLCREHTTG